MANVCLGCESEFETTHDDLEHFCSLTCEESYHDDDWLDWLDDEDELLDDYDLPLII